MLPSDWGAGLLGFYPRRASIQSMNTTETTEQIRDWQHKAEDVQEQISNWQAKATRAAREFGKTADEYVHENPWMVIATVAVIGCAIGYLLSSRRD